MRAYLIRSLIDRMLIIFVSAWVPALAAADERPCPFDDSSPPRPILTADIADRAKRLEIQIGDLRRMGSYADAIPLAQELHNLRRQEQGDDWWETVDSALAVRFCQTAAELSTNDQCKLAELETASRRLEALLRQARFADAFALAHERSILYRQFFGEENAATAEAMYDEAKCLQEVESYAEAEDRYRLALAVLRASHGNLHPMIACTLNDLGLFLYNMSDIASIEPLYREALDIFVLTKGMYHQETAVATNNLGMLLHTRGDYASAQQMHECSLFVRRELFGNEHTDVAQSLFQLGRLQKRRGDVDRSIELFQQALDICRSVHSDDPSTLSLALNGLGAALQTKGNFAAAEPLLRESLAIERRIRGPRHAAVATALNNLGSLLEAKGDVQAAEAMYEEALEIRQSLVGKDSSELIAMLNNLAGLLRRKGDLKSAEQLYRRSLDIRRKTLDADDPAIVTALNNLAVTLQTKGDGLNAEAAYLEALTIIRKRPDGNHPSTGTVLQNLGGLVLSRGDHAAAEQYFKEALSVIRSVHGDQHPRVASILQEFGAFLAHAGRSEEAATAFREALFIAEQQRTLVVGDEAHRAAFSRRLHMPMIASRLTDVLVWLKRPEEALNVLERGRARALSDLLARSDRDLAALATAVGDEEALALASALESQKAARAALAKAQDKLSKLNRPPDPPTDDHTELVERERGIVRECRQRVTDSEAAVHSILHRFWPDAQPSSVSEARSSLGAKDVVLTFNWSPPGVSAFLLPGMDGGKLIAWRIAEGGPPNVALHELVRQVQEEWSTNSPSRSTSDQSELAAELSRKLFVDARAREMICAARRLIVIADGPLRNLPLEALPLVCDDPTSDIPSQLLLTSGPAITVADSLTVYLNRLREAKKKTDTTLAAPVALVVADPAFGKWQDDVADAVENSSGLRGKSASDAQRSALEQLTLFGGVLQPLQGSKLEAKLIARTVHAAGGSVTTLLGEASTLSNLEAEVNGATILHLATHGLIGSDAAPYDASLALTPPHSLTEDDNGFLTLERLTRSWRGKLSQCQLVVLSGCETHHGVHRGDSVMALPWGFMYAGAPTVVASRWKVDDTATVLLMGRFYENLLGQFDGPRGQYKGSDRMPVAEALREAKAWLRALPPGPAQGMIERGGLAAEPLLIREGERILDFSHPYYWAGFVCVGYGE